MANGSTPMLLAGITARLTGYRDGDLDVAGNGSGAAVFLSTWRGLGFPADSLRQRRP